jgi:hypothetical protein
VSGASVTVTELQHVVSPERPDDEPAHEAGGQRREQDSDDDAEVDLSSHHATPDRRRQTIPPISSANAAIGSMTNAAVKSVILSRMASVLPRPSFRKACAGPAKAGNRF